MSKKKTLAVQCASSTVTFFLSGIMTVYALSGVVLIFRDSDFETGKTSC
jgi:hypothetical protein